MLFYMLNQFKLHKWTLSVVKNFILYLFGKKNVSNKETNGSFLVLPIYTLCQTQYTLVVVKTSAI